MTEMRNMLLATAALLLSVPGLAMATDDEMDIKAGATVIQDNQATVEAMSEESNASGATKMPDGARGLQTTNTEEGRKKSEAFV
jgi:hypothetical protein